MTLGTRIREARDDAGMNQADLAYKIGIKKQSISSLEKGDTRETGKLYRIAKVLGVEPEWLDTGNDPKNPVVNLEPPYNPGLMRDVIEGVITYLYDRDLPRPNPNNIAVECDRIYRSQLGKTDEESAVAIPTLVEYSLEIKGGQT